MRARISVFKLSAACALLCASCGTQAPPEPGLRFSVVDVGQGLSQIASSDGEAVVFDVGDTGATLQWLEAYGRAGSPRIGDIVISHSHADHMGGLANLPGSLNFSGEIVTSVFEDTALIRNSCGTWASRIRFKTVARGDTITGPADVYSICLWPPRNAPVQVPVSDEDKNRYSLCFIVRYQTGSVLVTSDIDTSAEQSLAVEYGPALAADIIVVPHHGSAYSVDPVFYGYVAPYWAVISCAAQNPYGHPAQKTIDMLFQMHAELFLTSVDGTVTAENNGYYWTLQGESE
jgi:competence protein ComEC